MRSFLLTALLICCVAALAPAQVSITKSPTGWELTNGAIRLQLTLSSDFVSVKSLRREGGPEWAVAGTPLIAFPDEPSKAYRLSLIHI